MGLLEAAIRYRRRGWSVIPINTQTKKPPIKWAEFQQRLPTEDEIRGWWEEFPDANIGVITGRISRLAVVDVDPDRGGSTDDIPKECRTGRIAKTGGGGWHLYYRLSADTPAISNRVDVKPGIDVRGEGGYVVAPPSHHSSGRSYRWAEKGQISRNLPPFILGPSSPNGSNGKHHVRGREEAWITEALQQGLKEGEGRDNMAARLAGYFINKSVPEDIIIETLAAWDLKNDPPLTRRVIEEKVHSVMKTHNRRLQQRLKPAVRLSEQEPSDPFALTPLHTYMSVYGDQPVKWTIQDWLPEQTIAMAVAPPGTYKTWLELALAVSVASGRPFLGKYEILAPGPVIIVQQEDYHGQMAERLAVVVGSLFDYGARSDDDRYSYTAPPRLPIYLHPDRKFRFDDSVVVEALAERIEAIRPALIIIDPLYSTGRMDDFGVDLVENMWPVKTLRDRYGCSFFISHHTGKGKAETDREDLWGIQFLNAFMETGWQIRRKDQPNTARIRRHFKVRQDAEEETIKFDISTEAPYKFEVNVHHKQSKDEEGPDLIDIIQHHGPIGTSDIAKLVGLDKSTVSRRLNKLAEADVISKDEKGQYVAAGEFNISPE